MASKTSYRMKDGTDGKTRKKT